MGKQNFKLTLLLSAAIASSIFSTIETFGNDCQQLVAKSDPTKCQGSDSLYANFAGIVKLFPTEHQTLAAQSKPYFDKSKGVCASFWSKYIKSVSEINPIKAKLCAIKVPPIPDKQNKLNMAAIQLYTNQYRKMAELDGKLVQTINFINEQRIGLDKASSFITACLSASGTNENCQKSSTEIKEILGLAEKFNFPSRLVKIRNCFCCKIPAIRHKC